MPSYPTDPETITRQSYEYIDEHMALPDGFTDTQRRVARRVVHTMGDLEIPTKLRFAGEPIPHALEAIEQKRPLVTDVTMVQSGIRSSLIDDCELKTNCYVHDEATRRMAERDGGTRSAAGLRRAGGQHDSFWLAVGNAPTMLLELTELADQWGDRVPVVIGVPVGFVSVEESKRRLLDSSFPAIVLEGTRGGSPVAASIVNALLEIASDQTDE